jgi:hypothetical protein
MFCDYGAEWPLWDDGMITPESLGLSPALTQRLRAWTDYYLAHATSDRNWLVSSQQDAVWSADGKRLSDHMNRELRGAAYVRYLGS